MSNCRKFKWQRASDQISVNSLKEALLESEVKEAAGNKSTWQIIQCSEWRGWTKTTTTTTLSSSRPLGHNHAEKSVFVEQQRALTDWTDYMCQYKQFLWLIFRAGETTKKHIKTKFYFDFGAFNTENNKIKKTWNKKVVQSVFECMQLNKSGGGRAAFRIQWEQRVRRK